MSNRKQWIKTYCLNWNDRRDRDIARYIEDLPRGKSTEIFRKAIEIIAGLENGDIEPLLLHYPSVAAQLVVDAQASDIATLASAIEKLAQAAASSASGGGRGSDGSGNGGGFKRSAQVVEPLQVDTGQLVMAEAKAEKGKAASNLGKGLMGFTM